VYHASCGGIDVPEAELTEVLEGAIEELSGNPAKMALAPFAVDREMLSRIAYYEMNAGE
jgi:hypothetical protein